MKLGIVAGCRDGRGYCSHGTMAIYGHLSRCTCSAASWQQEGAAPVPGDQHGPTRCTQACRGPGGGFGRAGHISGHSQKLWLWHRMSRRDGGGLLSERVQGILRGRVRIHDYGFGGVFFGTGCQAHSRERDHLPPPKGAAQTDDRAPWGVGPRAGGFSLQTPGKQASKQVRIVSLNGDR